MRPHPITSRRLPEESTLSALASDLLARLPTMTGEEQNLGLEIYRQLAHGAPVPRASIAEALVVPRDTVDELLKRPNLRCLTYTDTAGRIIGFGGLAVQEMPHLFKVDGRTLYTWCAWDSLFIPVILGVEAEVESPAPGSTARVRLRVAPDEVKHVEPRSAVMSFLLPSAQTFQADVLKAMASFCHYIFFFPDPEIAAAWTSSHPDTGVISVPDAFELGRQMVAARWRPAL
jgi:alkylmercury lyase